VERRMTLERKVKNGIVLLLAVQKGRRKKEIERRINEQRVKIHK
jgi:hypothetical protein